MTKGNYILRFAGPFGLTNDEVSPLWASQVAREPGIYLWTVPYGQGGYLVTYVGETSASFNQRIKAHLIQTLGGNYRICDPDRLRQGEAKVLWDGLWRQGTRDKMPEYLERLEELMPVIRKSVQTERIFVAPLRITRRLRQRIEGAIATHLKA